MASLRFKRRLTQVSPNGKHVWTLRVGIGWWPCLKGPFVHVGIGKWLFDLWYGEESYES